MSVETEAASETTTSWKYAWYDCIGNCSITIPSFLYCLWPWLFHKVATELQYYPVGGNGQCFFCIIATFVVVQLVASFAGAIFNPVLVPILSVIDLFFSILLCVTIFALRNRVRRNKNIAPACCNGDVEDCLMACFCGCCSMQQIGRELDITDIPYCTIPSAPCDPQTRMSLKM